MIRNVGILSFFLGLLACLNVVDSQNFDSADTSSLATPEACARACTENEPPKTCYFKFHLESYTTLGAACNLCTPNATNAYTPSCQCVLADGVERAILTANRMLPGPSIQLCVNDSAVIDLVNNLEGMEVTIHWHGVLQRGTQYYDGVPMVTQCPIPEGTTFRYQWVAETPGTLFWHAHTGLQKVDGLYGSIIVRQPKAEDPNGQLYQYDLASHVMILGDWFHELASERFPGRLATLVGQEPASILINGKGQYKSPKSENFTTTPLEVFTVIPGYRYRFRVINAFGTVCPAQLVIEGHNLTVIATDGEAVEPVQVNAINSFSGERYDFILEANNTVGAYWIQVRGLGVCGFDGVQQHAILQYQGGPDTPSTPRPTYDNALPQYVVLNPLDARCHEERADGVCINQLRNAKTTDTAILQETPDVKIFLPFRFYQYNPENLFAPNTYDKFLVAGGGIHTLSLVDEISWMAPPSPLLSQFYDNDEQIFCNADNRPAGCGENCSCTHIIKIPLNALVEIVVVDEVQIANLSHPFHLHGYTFNVIGMGRSTDQNITKINLKHAIEMDRLGLLERHLKDGDLPSRKDTIAVPNNGYVVIRFIADNPGFWIFHCHFMFHLAVGMNVVFQVGSIDDLPPVPTNFPKCGNFLPPINYS